MKILRMTTNDPAGTSILFTDAVNRYTEHTSRLITTSEKYEFHFKKDLHAPDVKDFDEIHQLLKDSDIYHFEILSDESMEIGPLKVKDYIKNKVILHGHHGHPDFRLNPDKYRLKYQKLKRKVLVSTPDLKLGLPDAYWIPNLVPINNPLYMPSDERYDDFTVGHSPTRTDLKDTVRLLKAAHKAGVNVDIIMNTPHKECLRRKQKCHVIFDHLQGYYGVSSLESLSQGIPVIAKLSDWVERNIKEFAETESLPWLLFRELGTVVLQVKFGHYPYGGKHFRQMGDWCRKFMVDHWSDKKVVNRLIKFYNTL